MCFKQILDWINKNHVIETAVLWIVGLSMLYIYMMYFYIWIISSPEFIWSRDNNIIKFILTVPNLFYIPVIVITCVFSLTQNKNLLMTAYILKTRRIIRFSIYFILSFLQVLLVYALVISAKGEILIGKSILVQNLYALISAVVSYTYTPAFPLTLIYAVWELNERLPYGIQKRLSAFFNNTLMQFVFILTVLLFPFQLVCALKFESDELNFIYLLYLVVIIFSIPLLVSKGMTKLVKYSKKYIIVLLIIFGGLFYVGHNILYYTQLHVLCYVYPAMYILLLVFYEPIKKLRLKNKQERVLLETEIGYKKLSRF